MPRSYAVPLCAVTLVFCASVAFADGSDPALFEDGSNCSGTYWCTDSGVATDPISGMSTEYYTFRGSILGTLTTGDVLIREISSLDISDLLRFEYVTVSGSEVPIVFIFSSDIAGGLGADVGIPATFQSNHVTVFETLTGISIYHPASASDPGYFTNNADIIYGLTSADVPEPTSVLLLGSILAIVFMAMRRHQPGKA